MKKTIAFFVFLVFFFTTNAQDAFTRKDSLRGGLRFERTCFDVLHYGLDIKINILEKSIVGFNEIQFKII